MIKKLLLIIFIFFFLSPNNVSAQEDFFVEADVIYHINKNGSSLTTFNISLQNLNDDVYAQSYTLNLESLNPQNIEVIYEGEIPPYKVTRLNNDYKVEINFDDTLVGKGKTRSISVVFSDDSLIERKGEVWEIQIPKLSDFSSFDNYNATIIIPEQFGRLAFISPQPQSSEIIGEDIIYYFNENASAESGISAGFGEFQVFTFSINYHLENPLNSQSLVEIALPPDTAFQKVYYQNIKPDFDSISVDLDGNWIASYSLKPREKLDVNVFGSVQIFASPVPLPPPLSKTLADNKAATSFWQSDDPEIIALSDELQTPKRIYDYTVQTLTYDYDRVKPNIQRYGAKEALINKKSAICMEFTDLFIALSRAADIPAREINGFAYTENPEIQPLSLVADVLHAWPEYWDEEKKVWIPVDPTWGATSGVDYFSKLDLRHFTFVIHGLDDTKPYPPGSYKLGPNPQKDVFVSFGQLPSDRSPKLDLEVTRIKNLPLTKTKFQVTFKNQGQGAIYELKPEIYFDNELFQETYIEVIPPGGSQVLDVTIPFSLFAAKTPDNVFVITDNKKVDIPTYKNQIILVNSVTLTTILISIVIIILQKSGKLNPFYKKLNLKKYAKYFKKTTKNSF